MEKIELFDRYIMGKLSASEKTEFDTRLESDENFASGFMVYLLTVQGIRKEVEQDNIEFGAVMKKLSREQLCEIIGKKEKATVIAKQKVISFKPWIWQITSIAAVVIIAFTVVFRQNSEFTAYKDDVAATIPVLADNASFRGGVNIDNMSDTELRQILPKLEADYKSSRDNDELFDNGQTLAMAYLSLHEREKAKNVFTELIDKLGNNPDFESDVEKWRSILRLLD